MTSGYVYDMKFAVLDRAHIFSYMCMYILDTCTHKDVGRGDEEE